MMARSHVPFAITWWWLYCIATGMSAIGLGTLIAGIGGLLPDLDHPKSALGRRLFFISVPLSALAGHRGITHSLIAVGGVIAVLVAVTALPEYAAYRWMVAPLCVGYLSHLAGDALTPSGVPLLYPIRKNYSLKLFPTGDWKETATIGAIGLLVFVFGGIGDRMLQTIEPFFETLRSLRRPTN